MATKKNKQFTSEDKLIYQLGYRNGQADKEAEVKRTMILLRTTNGKLWDELTRLDNLQPLVGPGAVIAPLAFMQLLISKMPVTVRYHYRDKLKKLIKYPYVKI